MHNSVAQMSGTGTRIQLITKGPAMSTSSVSTKDGIQQQHSDRWFMGVLLKQLNHPL